MDLTPGIWNDQCLRTWTRLRFYNHSINLNGQTESGERNVRFYTVMTNKVVKETEIIPVFAPVMVPMSDHHKPPEIVKLTFATVLRILFTIEWK